MSVATDAALVAQNERHDDDGNNPIKDTNALTKLTAIERGARDSEVLFKIKALQAELPGIVDQILAAHARGGSSTKSNMLRSKWERAFRAEMNDHQFRDRSLRFARIDATRLDGHSSSSMGSARRGLPASAPTFGIFAESPPIVDSRDATDQHKAGVEDRYESSTIWNRMRPSAENHSWENVDSAAQVNNTRWDDLGLVSSSEGNGNARDHKFSLTVPVEKAEKILDAVASDTALIEDLSEQEQIFFSHLATDTDDNDGCSSESLKSLKSTNSQADEAFCGGDNYGMSVALIAPVDKSGLKQSAVKSMPVCMLREREEFSDGSKKAKVEVTQAVILLRLMSDDDWRTFTNIPKDIEEYESNAEERCSISSNGTRDGVKRINNASIQSLLDLLRSQSVAAHSVLSTSEYNSALARVALSPELSEDDVLDLLMQFHSQMEALALAGVTEARPDPTTYEIILLTLYHRLAAYDDAFRIMQKFMISTKAYWTSHTLEAAMLILRKQNATEVALRLFDELQTEGSAEIDITTSAYRSLVHLTQFHDDRKPAIVVLQHALRKNGRKRDRELDAVFIDAIRWPRQNRFGKGIDNSLVLRDIIGMLEKERIYIPGIAVWKELVNAAISAAEEDESRWILISRVFTCLTWSAPGYCPDQQLLRNGLKASKALNDPLLASDLIWRSVINSPTTRSAVPTDGFGPQDIPFMDFVGAMDICVNKGDMTSCRKILTSAKRAGLAGRNLRALYLLNLKGFAYRGDVDHCELLIVDMLEKSLEPNEECYAALLHGYAVANNFDRAKSLMESLESGEIGLVPGPSTYDAYTLACIRCSSWSNVMAAYKTMKERGITPSPPTCHGIIFSASKEGGKNAVRTVLEEFYAAGLPLTEASAVLAMKILIPSNVDQKVDSLASARENLRTMKVDDVPLPQSTLDLMRSLRRCELAEQRRSSGGLSEHAVQEERIKAWQSVLQALLAYVDRLSKTGVES